MKEFNISASVEKVITLSVVAENEEDAIRIAQERIMNSSEDFAQILDVCIED